jgi:hypothetical protein
VPTKYQPKVSKFKAYATNYQMVLMAQKLGFGIDKLSEVFAHFGLSPAKGGYNKWKALQDIIGEAEQAVCAEVLSGNIQAAVVLYQDEAKEQYTSWLEAAEDQPTQEQKVNKMESLLNLKDGRVGIDCGADMAWQRRAIGFGKMNSKSGMNFCVELKTRRIVNMVVYSKQCTKCERWKITHPMVPAPPHRCSHNFDASNSSKSMEADATVKHKEDLEVAATGVYMRRLCTDDDSSVRANTKYNLTEFYNDKYGEHNWSSHDDNVDWPYTTIIKDDGTEKRVYMSPRQDAGHLPLQCYPIDRYLTDVGHRVRCIAKGLFKIQSKSKKVPPGKLSSAECQKLKKTAGLFFKKNNGLPFVEFHSRAPCMYLHHFDDHSCCDIAWCKPLQSKRTDGIDATVLSDAYRRRFRDKEVDWVTFKAVEDIYAAYLTKDAMWQCYHGYDTNKNESLNRKCSATAPKDRYLSGTMTLSDRFSLIVAVDSVGYVNTYVRVLAKVGFDIALVCPVLQEWCSRVDDRLTKSGEWRKKPEVKRKRVADVTALVNAWCNAELKAARQGKEYASGSAIVVNRGNSNSSQNDESKTDYENQEYQKI